MTQAASSTSTTKPRSEIARTVARWIVTVAMVAVGVTHFTSPEFFLAIMPPFIPFHLAMVWISGACEIALGLALIPERTRRLASFGLVALYVAVFPANIYMAVAHIQPGGEPVPEWAAWARLPFQPLFMLLAWWVGRPAVDSARTGAGAGTGGGAGAGTGTRAGTGTGVGAR